MDEVECLVQMLRWLEEHERQGGLIGKASEAARLALIPLYQLLDPDKQLAKASLRARFTKGTLSQVEFEMANMQFPNLLERVSPQAFAVKNSVEAPSPALLPILVVPPPVSVSIVPELHPEPASGPGPKSVLPVQATVPVAVPILTAVSKVRSPMGLVDGLMAAIDVQQDSVLARNAELNYELEGLRSQEAELSAGIAKLVADLDLVRAGIDGRMQEAAENIAFRATCETMRNHINQTTVQLPPAGQGSSFDAARVQEVATAALAARVDTQFEAAARVAEMRHKAIMSELLRVTSPPSRTQFGDPFDPDSDQPPPDWPGPGRG